MIAGNSTGHETKHAIREIASIGMRIENSMPMIFDVRRGVTGMTATSGTRLISLLIVDAAPSRVMTALAATMISAAPPAKIVDIEKMDQVDTAKPAGVMTDQPNDMGIDLTEVTNSPVPVTIARRIATADDTTLDETATGIVMTADTKALLIVVVTAITATTTMTDDMSSRVAHEVIFHHITATSGTMSVTSTIVMATSPTPTVIMGIMNSMDIITGISPTTVDTITDGIMNSQAIMEADTDNTSMVMAVRDGADTILLDEPTEGLLAGKTGRDIRRRSR